MKEPNSLEEAKAHIDRIRHDKGLDSAQAQNQNAADLERALKIVSDELYHKSTHFLLELIQNADDNSYDTESGVKPMLDITLYDGHLRVDCNEVGFTPRNVEAICKIGSSTKAGAENTTRYVGEKGIGFKSVFKVADVVYITSQNYSFKFEKAGPLGMIAPVWTDFPILSRRGYTTFYLQLSPHCNKDDLLKELLALDSRMLIFLRQLRQINIRVERTGRAPLCRTLSRLPDSVGASSGPVIVTLRQDAQIFKYVIFSHKVQNLPREPKREGIHDSQALLAFPIKSDLQPKLEGQQVYAFLPIRDYGFQFLLQADFLLIASREDVDDSSEWNRALRDSFVDALVEAARWFNTRPLKYTWSRFLPGKAIISGFFAPLKYAILKRFAQEQLLENCTGRLVAASTLTYYPEQYCDPEGQPLTSTPSTAGQYLSPNYDAADHEALSTLGVKEMTGSRFVKDLTRLVRDMPTVFRSQSQEWHSNLAKCVIPLAVHEEHYPKIAALKMIPLRDGTWVSTSPENIFFPGDQYGLTVPSGIGLMIVDSDAAADLTRKQLFIGLSVKEFTTLGICKMIIHTHNDPRFSPQQIEKAALIEQAVFLYRARWRLEERYNFFLRD